MPMIYTVRCRYSDSGTGDGERFPGIEEGQYVWQAPYDGPLKGLRLRVWRLRAAGWDRTSAKRRIVIAWPLKRIRREPAPRWAVSTSPWRAPAGPAPLTRSVMPFDGMPKGQSAGLGGMSDRKPDLLGLMPDGQSYTLGLVPDIVRGRAEAMADMAGIMVQVCRGARTGHGERTENDGHDYEAV